LAQDTFIKAHAALNDLADPEKIRSWLFGIAYRRFLDHARKAKRRRELSQQQVVPDPVAGPSGQALDVERAMDTLTPECRAVVMLCLLHGLTHSEAATATALPLGTVKSHVNRGKAKLRTVLADYAPPQKSDTRQNQSRGLS
jgi:RNA polymerase sigma-70 factor (ECF subfamily)